MELIVFDLDGTLLGADSRISPFTRDTLRALRERGILYTVATGRALHAAADLIDGHGFTLPQAYKNGVLIWNPDAGGYSHHRYLTGPEIAHVVEAMEHAGVTPFLSTLEAGRVHAIYHPPFRAAADEKLASVMNLRADLTLRPLERLPADAHVTSISALAAPGRIQAVRSLVDDEPDLVAYAGPAGEGADLAWIDIHHVDGSKGRAVEVLRKDLGIDRVVCFGDGDNDLSMFATADEAYAPANADAQVRAAATAVIGRHDEDGIARFLRERFDL
jgi:hydroxymethylpyrimidine pyrophosphatase-like HAD family hydrolase